MKITIKSESELIKVCEKLEVLLKEASVVLLKGDMAAGKTTFVKAFCQYKGVMDTAASPTFGLVNEYAYKGGKIYHFDLYRIEDEEELYDIGFEEYLDSGNICFVEWPGKAPYLFDQNALHVVIEPVNETERSVKILSASAYNAQSVAEQL